MEDDAPQLQFLVDNVGCCNLHGPMMEGSVRLLEARREPRCEIKSDAVIAVVAVSRKGSRLWLLRGFPAGCVCPSICLELPLFDPPIDVDSSSHHGHLCGQAPSNWFVGQRSLCTEVWASSALETSLMERSMARSPWSLGSIGRLTTGQRQRMFKGHLLRY